MLYYRDFLEHIEVKQLTVKLKEEDWENEDETWNTNSGVTRLMASDSCFM